MVSYLHVAVDEKQLAGWKAAAKSRDLSLSGWVRMTLDREGKNVGTPSEGVRVDVLDKSFRVRPFGQTSGVFAVDCPGTHMAGVQCDGCGGSKW